MTESPNISKWNLHKRIYNPCLNPADLKGRLRDLLPPDSMRAQKSHQPALPADRIPELFAELQKHPSITSKLIQYTILTVSRASNARLSL